MSCGGTVFCSDENYMWGSSLWGYYAMLTMSLEN